MANKTEKLQNSINSITGQTISYFSKEQKEKLKEKVENLEEETNSKRKASKKVMLTLRLTESEKAIIEENASQKGESVSEYIRKILIKSGVI